MQRRDLMKAGCAGGIAALLGPQLFAEVTETTRTAAGPVPRRPLGKTGCELSVIGFGGIILMGEDQEKGNRLVAEAMDRGVNYFDVAPQYGKGEAQQKLGPALKPYRDKAFLACKTLKRDKAGAAADLRESLMALQTDHLDLYQMHSIKDLDKDVAVALGPGGALEAFVEARQQGLVRYLGFSSHSVEAALKAIETGLFDTILHPVNFVCHFQNGFDTAPLEAARKQGMGMLALKAMARGPWPAEIKWADRPFKKAWYQPIDDPALAALALRWTLSQGVTAAVSPGDERLFAMAVNVASQYKPLEPAEENALREVARGLTPIFPQTPKPARQ